ncbi:MAG: type I DNA topoisomerase [Pseudomonadota bacterium]
MSRALVVVESPTKVKTLAKYLGRNFTVKASVGHVMDLPKSKLGVEIGDRFEPVYEVIKGKQKVLKEIRDAAKKADVIYLAPDPDREGEAIAWHIAGDLGLNKKKKLTKAKIYRVLINEITKKGVEEALASPGELNRPRYESQQARRILDRLVGYQVSPILWEKVRRGLSAGRVQSVALRIIVDREREIRKFIPREYWSVEADVSASEPPPFVLHLTTRKGKKIEIVREAEAREIEALLKSLPFVVSDVAVQEKKRTPPPAFTTSKLQQDAARKLGFTAKKTMMVAQQLYEGVELGDEGAVGLITYMRTDSTRLSNDALTAAREFIAKTYGKEFLPEKPRVYKLSKKAQDAHEAIRPSSMLFPPEKVKPFLRKDQFNLYKLIWERFMACQMTEAIYEQTTVDVTSGEFGLRAAGTVLSSEGYMKLYVEPEDPDAEGEESEKLPPLRAGEKLKLEKITPNQHFTKPPPRFNEASLVKELEEDGIGRPSTYASILSTLQDRKYAQKEQLSFLPTDLGFLVSDLLVEHFPDVMNVEFTAKMEEELDQVEEGEKDWQEVLHEFYKPFSRSVRSAKKQMRDVKREETPTEHTCEKCGKPMVIKWGRHGHFLACSGYPECKNTKEFKKTEDGKVHILAQPTTQEICSECKSPMVVKTGRFGKFLACSRYPECKHTSSISTGIKCPEPGCGGDIVERRSRRGKMFYGCSRYPKCKHASWNKPVACPCPTCKAPYLIEKFSKKEGAFIACSNKDCDYKKTSEVA